MTQMIQRVRCFGVSLLVFALALAVPSAAAAYTLSTTVTTDGVVSMAGGTLGMACRASSSAPWTSCGSSVAAGTQVSIDAQINEGYWFMWFTTQPYLAGCTTTNWGWGYSSNPATHCGFTMPSSDAFLNAEFQLP